MKYFPENCEVFFLLLGIIVTKHNFSNSYLKFLVFKFS